MAITATSAPMKTTVRRAPVTATAAPVSTSVRAAPITATAAPATVNANRAPHQMGELEVPGANEEYWNKFKEWFSQPTTIEGLFKQYGDRFVQPTQQTELWNDVRGMLNEPTTLEQMFGQYGSQFWQPTQSEDFYATNRRQFKAPVVFEQYAPGAAEEMLQPGAMQKFQEGFRTPQGITNQGALQKLWGSTGAGLTGMTGQQNQAQQAYQDFLANRPDIAKEPGYGTYYDTAVKRAMEDIQKSAAARGSFGTTAAGDQERLAAEGLRAAQARDEADYNLARLGEQRQWDTLSGALANQAQQAQQNWLDTLGSLAGGAEGMNLARTQEQRGWQTLGGNLANQAETLNLARQQGGADILQNAQNSALSRLLGGVNAAATADERALSNLLGGFGVSQNVDAGNLSRLLGAGQLAGGADQSTLAGLTNLMALGQGVDTTALSKILGGGQLSGGAQEAWRNRLMDEFTKTFSAGTQLSGTVGNAYNSMFGSDADIINMIASLMLGGTKEGASVAGQNEAKLRDLLGKIPGLGQ